MGRKDTRISDIPGEWRATAQNTPAIVPEVKGVPEEGEGGFTTALFLVRQLVGKEADAQPDEIATRYTRFRPERLH